MTVEARLGVRRVSSEINKEQEVSCLETQKREVVEQLQKQSQQSAELSVLKRKAGSFRQEQA